MIITNFYRGQTNKLSGFTFNTETNTYKYCVLAWAENNAVDDNIVASYNDLGFPDTYTADDEVDLDAI